MMRIRQTMLLTLILGIVGTATQAALIGHWKLDEGSGATTADSSASGNDGTLEGNTADGWVTNNALLAPVPSGTSAAVEFAWDDTNDSIGTDDSIGVGGANLYNLLDTQDGPSAGTIAFWFNASTVANMNGVAKRFEYSLRFRDNNGDLTMRWDMFGDNSGNDGDAISLNEWHHAAVSFTAGTGGTLYLDGEVYQTYTSNDTSNNGGAEVTIGNIPDGPGFQGLIDEVRIYDEALDQSAIQALAIPEPASLALIGLGATLMVRRRR